MGGSSFATGGGGAGLSPTTSVADICAVRSWWLVATMRMEALVACWGTPSIAPLPPPSIAEGQAVRQSARGQPQPLAAGVSEGRQLRSISGPDRGGRQVDIRLRGLWRQRVSQRFGCHRAWRRSGGFRRRRGLNSRGLGLPGRIRFRAGGDGGFVPSCDPDEGASGGNCCDVRGGNFVVGEVVASSAGPADGAENVPAHRARSSRKT